MFRTSAAPAEICARCGRYRRKLLANLALLRDGSQSDLKRRGVEKTLEGIRLRVKHSLKLLEGLVTLSTIPEVRAWNVPKAELEDIHAATALPDKLGGLGFNAKPAGREQLLQLHQRCKRLQEEVDFLLDDCARAGRNAHAVVDELSQQLSALTAPQRGSGASGIVVPTGAHAGTESEGRPLIFSFELGSLSSEERSGFSAGMAQEVYEGMLHFEQLRQRFDRLQTGVQLLPASGSGEYRKDAQHRLLLRQRAGRLLSGEWSAVRWATQCGQTLSGGPGPASASTQMPCGRVVLDSDDETDAGDVSDTEGY